MAKPQNLRGWNAVITGGAGGLGRAIAARLIQRGVRCLLVDIDADALARAVQALGPLACAQAADLTDPAARDRLAERLDTDWGSCSCWSTMPASWAPRRSNSARPSRSAANWS